MTAIEMMLRQALDYTEEDRLRDVIRKFRNDLVIHDLEAQFHE
jgi:dTDP-4-dehydrorhamnose reductase